jgi:hypothetical protein
MSRSMNRNSENVINCGHAREVPPPPKRRQSVADMKLAWAAQKAALATSATSMPASQPEATLGSGPRLLPRSFQSIIG